MVLVYQICTQVSKMKFKESACLISIVPLTSIYIFEEKKPHSHATLRSNVLSKCRHLYSTYILKWILASNCRMSCFLPIHYIVSHLPHKGMFLLIKTWQWWSRYITKIHYYWKFARVHCELICSSCKNLSIFVPAVFHKSKNNSNIISFYIVASKDGTAQAWPGI